MSKKNKFSEAMAKCNKDLDAYIAFVLTMDDYIEVQDHKDTIIEMNLATYRSQIYGVKIFVSEFVTKSLLLYNTYEGYKTIQLD